MPHKQLIEDPFGFYHTLRSHASLQSDAILKQHYCKTSVFSTAKLTSASATKNYDTRVQPYMGGVYFIILI